MSRLGTKIGGVDLATLGWTLTGAPDTPQGVRLSWPSERPIGSSELIPLSSRPTETPVPLILHGVVEGTNRAAMLSQIDEIVNRAAAGEVEIEVTGLRTGRWFGRLERTVTNDPLPAAIQPLSLYFDLLDPWRYGDIETVGSIGSTAKAVPLGTATASPRDHQWTLTGGSGSATIIIANRSGTEVARLELTGSISAGAITFDHADGTIVRGTESLLDRLSPRSTFPLVWNIGWADVPNSAWPTIRTTRGTLTLRHRKAYLR